MPSNFTSTILRWERRKDSPVCLTEPEEKHMISVSCQHITLHLLSMPSSLSSSEIHLDHHLRCQLPNPPTQKWWRQQWLFEQVSPCLYKLTSDGRCCLFLSLSPPPSRGSHRALISAWSEISKVTSHLVAVTQWYVEPHSAARERSLHPG